MVFSFLHLKILAVRFRWHPKSQRSTHSTADSIQIDAISLTVLANSSVFCQKKKLKKKPQVISAPAVVTTNGMIAS